MNSTGHAAAEISIRIADPSEYETLGVLYRAWGYRAGITPGSVVFAAMLGAETVGLVRRTIEDDTTMLRGMYIHPEHRRRGIGTQLLTAFVADLGDADCYCIPFTHLVSFYGQSGFRVFPESAAPAFLRERLAVYRAEGRDMLVMRRPRSAAN
ncbi:MAG TPA: GNAT family N-acetyltransferase [Gemmatimonadaceae bacterium]